MDLTTTFPLGQLVMTPGAQTTFDEKTRAECLQRHAKGDWGDLDDEDKRSNDQSIRSGGRLMSSYDLGDKQLWIITEADRTVTTLLLPEEY